MTRFARAKGSKSSNEKAPEDSTPWEVLKEQLLQAKKNNEEAKNRENAEKQRIENYENFLKERKTEKKPATWCDFPETNNTQNNKQGGKKKKNKRKLDKPDNGNTADNPKDASTLYKQEDESSEPPKKKNKSKGQNQGPQNQGDSSSTLQTEVTNKNKKKNKKNKQAAASNEAGGIDDDKPTNGTVSDNHAANIKPNKKKKNKNKNNDTNNTQATPNPPKNELSDKQINNNKAKKKKKLVDGKPVRRKETDDRSFQIIINGKEVELMRCDGFPVMKKDAERLAELQTSMINKGIPKSEVKRTMKLERRRAEKALAKVRRQVCFNCRKGGHNLSDCPELKSKIPGQDAPDGLCFKCGSTEHRQFECKVQRDKEFRFATCFICKEPGHIARQCPDNPKGLYPNGGSCKLCGDVTHLRKDCPTQNDKKEETSIKLSTLDATENIEDIPMQSKANPVESSKKPKKIKF